MRKLAEFFENTNFEYLNIGEEIEDFYFDIWKEAYLPSQNKKIIENNISEENKNIAFNGLSKRGKFLCQIYDFFECKNVAEVGTAEGYQFYTFCEHIKRSQNKSKVYTCDIRDVRNKQLASKYDDIGVFTPGTSKEMSERIMSDGEKIDIYWIDGDHRNTAVLTDVLRLAKTQSENCVWIFDDFNERFGIYDELKFLSTFSEKYVISLGPTASGLPNSMLIMRGRI